MKIESFLKDVGGASRVTSARREKFRKGSPLPEPEDPIRALSDALHPDMNGLAEYSRELNVVGVHAFALCADRYTAHVRNFAPLYGVPEESATGTANAALTYYLFRHGLVQQGTECLFLQGEAMGRRSLVSTIVHDDGTIAVGGQCCVLASGNLEL